MPDPDVDALHSPPRREFRLHPWLILPLGLSVGLLSGTFSYLLQRWIGNGRVRVPIGEYVWVVSFNLVVWLWWFTLIAGALWLGRHLRITRENAWRTVPAPRGARPPLRAAERPRGRHPAALRLLAVRIPGDAGGG